MLKHEVKRAVEGSGLARLRGLTVPNRRRAISGRTAFNVMKAYVEESNNTSAECWPGQDRLAQVAGVGVSNVAVAQDWLVQHGWLVALNPPVPGSRGLHVRLGVGTLPLDQVEQVGPGQTREEGAKESTIKRRGLTMKEVSDDLAAIWRGLLIEREKTKHGMRPGEREVHDAEYLRYVVAAAAPGFD